MTSSHRSDSDRSNGAGTNLGGAAAPPRGADVPALQVRNLSKTFGSTRVLRDLDLELTPGEVHALIGQNGSGKSTFVKILSGYQRPDPGAELRIAGRTVHGGDIGEHNVRFVHQDLAMVDNATVLENLVAVGPGARRRILDWRAEARRVDAMLQAYRLEIPHDRLVGSLHQVERAMLAVVRAVDSLDSAPHDADAVSGVLVLDEPTAYLPRDRIDRLLTMITDLARSGMTILFITHHLDEVLAVADRATVLRDGEKVATVSTQGLREDDLVASMLGGALHDRVPRQPRQLGRLALSATGISADGSPPLDLHLRQGEIVGITGVAGAGWEAVPYMLVGATPRTVGTLQLTNGRINLRRLNPARARVAGMALLPANRVGDSAVGALSLIDNATVAGIRNYSTLGVLRSKARRRATIESLASYRVVPAAPDALIATLSGGNQQKVLLAKWLETRPKVMLLHEPTQGVDVGAREQLLELIDRAAAHGTAVLLITAEHKDILELCDRALVFRAGRIATELNGEELAERTLLAACNGLDSPASSAQRPGPVE